MPEIKVIFKHAALPPPVTDVTIILDVHNARTLLKYISLYEANSPLCRQLAGLLRDGLGPRV